jgi:predicted nucleic acid-binding protein
VASPTFVDTNIFVYAVDTAEPTKQSVAQEVLATVRPLCISPQVMMEYYVTVTRKLQTPRKPQNAAADLNDMAALQVVPADTSLVLEAARASQRWQLSLWDALIVEAARAAECDRLLTEDLSNDTDFDGVRVENPFTG